jgi:hypothetical protein
VYRVTVITPLLRCCAALLSMDTPAGAAARNDQKMGVPV